MKILKSASSILFSVLLLTQTSGVAFASETPNLPEQATLNQFESNAPIIAPRIRNKNGTSSNWSGYAVESNLLNPLNNAVSDVKGTWTVPAVTCTSANTYSSTWVGIDGYSDGSVEQTGTEHDCINGQAQYYAWYEMYPKPGFKVNVPVKAGDVISAEVQYTGANNFVLTLTNQTAGKTFTTKQKSNGHRQSAEWIVEAPWSGSTLPLANFGTQNITNASMTLNGISGTINKSLWQFDAITMANASGGIKALPSPLASDGASFSVQWYASN